VPRLYVVTAHLVPTTQHSSHQLHHHRAPHLQWTGPTALSLDVTDLLVGPDGEPWLPPDGPTVFGPDMEWLLPPNNLDQSATATAAASPLLDSDFEDTALPPGLLDSPPHPLISDMDATPAGTGIQSLCTAVLAPPPPAVLLTPPHLQQGQEVEPAPGSSNSRPVERARDNKLNKLGLAADTVNPKTAKKQQQLSAYKGAQHDVAAEALSELLGMQLLAE
jgi:hypothetical protein